MKIRTLALGLALGALFLPLTRAQIERLTLDEMIAKTDNAVLAEITGQKVFRVDDPVDGPELYYTTLTLQGRSLEDGKPITVDVTYPGGFIDEEHGAHNSEAPSADDVKVGNTVVAFYRWSDNMGGGVAANALYASHGGLFRTVASPTGKVVLGRGEGYAIESNKSVANLESAIRNSAGKR
jgi:hypothetical protein